MAGSVLILVAAGVTIASGVRWWQEKPSTAHSAALFGGAVVLFVLIYAVGVLEWDVRGGAVTVSQARRLRRDLFASKQDVERLAQDVAKLATISLQSAYVLADGAQRLGGPTPAHWKRLGALAAQLEDVTKQDPGAFQKELDGMLQQIDAIVTAQVAYDARVGSLPPCEDPPAPPCRVTMPDGSWRIREAGGLLDRPE